MVRREKELIDAGKLEEYNEQIKDLGPGRREVVRQLTDEETINAKTESAWYLDHRVVVRLDKSTALRVIWDSAKKFKGYSLNDGLYKGPNYTNNLFRCFLALREEINA